MMMQLPPPSQQEQVYTAPRCHHSLVSPSSSSPSGSYSYEQSQQQQQQYQEELEDLQDVVGTMRRQEVLYYKMPQQQQRLTALPPYRPILIQWMFSVVEIFHLAPQIVPTALYYLDQCTSSTTRTLAGGGGEASSSLLLLPGITTTNTTAAQYYQLLGMTCLELAIKVHDTKMFPLQELVRMGQAGVVTVEQLIQMEAVVLKHLGWNLHPPTPHCFVHQYGRLLQVCCSTTNNGGNTTTASTASTSSISVERALLLVKRGVYSELLVTLPPSILAYAAMLAAMEEAPLSCCVSTLAKQSFCGHMVQVAGLSANSPGLSQAYQTMKRPSTASPAATSTSTSSDSSSSSSSTVATPSSSSAPQPQQQVYHQQQQYYPQQYQQQQQQYYPQQAQQHQYHYVSPAPSTTMAAAAAALSSQQYTLPQQQQQQQPMAAQGQNTYYVSPAAAASLASYSSTTITAGASFTGGSSSSSSTNSYNYNNNYSHPKNNNKYTEQPTMIYSAGEDLGFEVTLNPANLVGVVSTNDDVDDDNDVDDVDFEEEELAYELGNGLSLDNSPSNNHSNNKATSASAASSWMLAKNGVSPRQASGAISPERL
jgi:hypothetical protein